VLPILLGTATRFSEELTGGAKRYEAVIRLGWRSETDDAQGPLARGGALPTPTEAESALRTFVGTFEQRPPAFSARKVGGQAAYRAARGGAPLELAARTVTVESLELLEVDRGEGHLDLRVDLRCGPGTYVRSIARDLGERLASGGYLAALRRTEAAGLRVEDALAPDRLEELATRGALASALISIGDLLPLPRLQLSSADAARFRNGSTVAVEGGLDAGRYAVFTNGELLGVGRVEHERLRPEKVLAEPMADKAEVAAQ
jgi:tRNA pseudouridine55 synthase